MILKTWLGEVSAQNGIIIKDNFQDDIRATNLSLEIGQCMEAKHWIFGSNSNINNYKNSVSDNNPWYRVRVVKHRTPLVCVKLDQEYLNNCSLARKYGNNYSWWLFDENYKMLRNVK